MAHVWSRRAAGAVWAVILAMTVLLAVPAAADTADGIMSSFFQEPARGEAETSKEDGYVIRFADQYGEPVANVIISVCDELSCVLVVSGEDGTAAIDRTDGVSQIHLLKLPGGYSLEGETDFSLSEDMQTLDVVLTKE